MSELPKDSLEDILQGADQPSGLATVLRAIADAVADVAVALRTAGVTETGGTNTFGDKQLQADVIADNMIFDKLRSCGVVATASSEENSDMVPMGGSGFSVAFDPLDGSSIIGANFAVGSIFGIWPGPELLGRTGREQAAAVYSIYGPRTVLVVARQQPGKGAGVVQEFVCGPSGWLLARDNITVGHKKVFAPANLRAAAENAAYGELISQWMGDRYTLRYTGGLVPDVHHIITKGGGIFANPKSPSAPAKLRLLYECAPLAYVVEAAQGASHDGNGSVLDQKIVNSDIRTVLSIGSTAEVGKTIQALQQ